MTVGWLVLVSGVVYAVAIVWVFGLHPLVSVSTGETKPRSLFVDEHALPVQSRIIEQTINRFVVANHDETNACLLLSSLNAYCQQRNDTDPVLSITITPAHVSSPREEVFLGLVLPTVPINSSDEQCLNQKQFYSTESLNFLWNIVYYYRQAKWNSKRLRIVVAPSSKSLHSILSNFSEPRNHEYQNLYLSEKLTRESYLLDLSDLDSSFRWQEISLLSHDVHGTLPNMDMISYLLHLHPFHNIRLPLCSFESEINVVADTLLQVLQPLEIALRGKTSITSGSFQRRIDGYLHHLCTRSLGFFDSPRANLHASLNCFLQRNIDAIALTFHRNKPSLLKRTQNPRKLITTGSLPLLVFVFDLLYGSNNLEEELHHSYHHYILMGEQTFVGMNEYAIPGMLFTLSFFLLAMSFLHKSPTSNASFSFSRIFRGNRMSEAQSLKLVGHNISSSHLLTSLVIIVIQHRLTPVLTSYIKSITSEENKIFMSLFEMIAVILLSLLFLIVNFMMSKLSQNMKDFELEETLKLVSGLELLYSVVFPLLRVGIQDIVKLYVSSIVLYPVVIVCALIVHTVIIILKKESNGKKIFSWTLPILSILFLLGYLGLVWDVNRSWFVSRNNLGIEHFIFSVSMQFFRSMSSNVLILFIWHLIL